jgi:hypothetical protein
VLLDEGADQTQQFLLFRPCAPPQESRDIFMFHLPSGSDIGFVADEQSP